MRKFLLMIGLALLIFFVTVFVERRDIFLLPFLKTGPPIATTAESEALKETVRRYNQALMEAYHQGDSSPVGQFIGDGELQELLANDLRFLERQGRRLTLELLDLEFAEARPVTETLGFVTSRERWRYGYTDARSSQPVGGSQTVRAEVTYTLERRADAWRIVETGLKRRLSDRAG